MCSHSQRSFRKTSTNMSNEDRKIKRQIPYNRALMTQIRHEQIFVKRALFI